MKTGDLEPDWIVDVADESGAADFTTPGLTWRLEAWRETKDGPVAAFTDANPGSAAGTSNSRRVISHQFVDGETDTAGPLHAVVVAIWPGGNEQSFPGEGSVSLILEPSNP